MTTICWDGKELVSDSRVTYTLTEVRTNNTEKKTTTRRDDYYSKLMDGKSFLFDGKQVQAIGFAGALDVLGELKRQAAQAERHDLRIELFGLADTTPGTVIVEFDFDLIAVTEENVICIGYRVATGEFTFIKGPRNTFAAIGSSFKQMRAVLHLLPPARVAVTFGSLVDLNTGGNHNIWDGEFHTNVPRMSKWRAFVEMMKIAIRYEIAQKKLSRKPK